MSKQRPNPDKITNELRGASSFFRRDEPLSPAPVEPAEAAPPPVVNEDRSLIDDVMTARRHDVVTAPPPAPGFDINRETASHDTLRLAVDETRALDDLKAALKWDHDLAVSKNDICRIALHELIENFRAKGSASDAVKRLRKKQGRR